jgi:hypothetical protein
LRPEGFDELDRFMKDVENVTGNMGEGEAITPAEEVASATPTTPDVVAAAAPAPDLPVHEKVDAQETVPAAGDPWAARSILAANWFRRSPMPRRHIHG